MLLKRNLVLADVLDLIILWEFVLIGQVDHELIMEVEDAHIDHELIVEVEDAHIMVLEDDIQNDAHIGEQDDIPENDIQDELIVVPENDIQDDDLIPVMLMVHCMEEDDAVENILENIEVKVP